MDKNTFCTVLSAEEIAERKYPTKDHRYMHHEINQNKLLQAAFIAGYNTREKEINALLLRLEQIAKWPGNLPDDRYTTKTGPNDAALRGHMIVEMRRLAQNILSNYNK